ncbi:acyl--CoA ligase [Oceanicella actignis]|uniref:Acyl-CoA synthetase (AMP-forming)/AMP-acid ligase II n=1 Tax=Oceanicella actignis TaxID=1189325 RepID=A0A1M7TMS4_9RHOB|nr:acyl--CoA ligase [Oceanicella actignis]SET71688.1 Acyl-CoA synthetase (AMP-forming)/AMP-acid ligase II [Oceanicella actignis]SHN72034.1 Acyl-CoA synthetase (AMP-forming)/AMP-acid ligase II [Oceanicella actignis]
MSETIEALLAPHPDQAPALEAPGRAPLIHGALRALTGRVRDSLRRAGIGRGDRVAIVLPNGPEMAAAFLTVAQGATTAPLNPAYKAEEFDFYLSDLDAKAIILAEDESGPALTAARARGVGVIRLRPGAAAGDFELIPEGGPFGQADPAAPGPEDVALVLHTSGTTSRPKIVPLTQANLAASARNIGQALALGPQDRCLNVMPLFHIHGLVAATLASVAAGGATWCAPGFDALRFFAWLEQADPTWFTAVPTMHQAILARAPRNAEIIARARLRLIRSSSASLPPQVMEALERTFGCPVIESYGMTEAAHQMCSNPLPPRARKAGSVGVAAGPLVRTAHETENRLLPDGETGEVVISGPNVTPGYEANPEANAKAFFEAEGRRWFRTGDQGRFDEEGYLRITGRLKEIINRGGEKISPLEVDEALMDHPAVQQVVTFAIPHPKLGEEVGAAVVLREGAEANEAELRDFARRRLADFKCPRRIVILPEIPKGATGKLQRIGLAQKLGLA